MLTGERLTAMAESILRKADLNLRADGALVRCVLGVRPDLSTTAVLEVGEGDPVGVDAVSALLVLPAPLRDHESAIAQHFAAAGVVAAVEVSEYWTFAPGDTVAAAAYADGTGAPPSEHPGRMEGVLVGAWWPAGRFAHIATRRIVRAPSGPYLRPWTGEAARVAEQIAAGGPGVGMLSWLELLLPVEAT